MEFFDKLKNKDKSEKIAKERNKIKEQLMSKLSSIKFNEKEINEVMGIIDMAEAKIEKIKVSMVGTNINNDDPGGVTNSRLGEIHYLQNQMALDIRNKIDEIKKLKGL